MHRLCNSCVTKYVLLISMFPWLIYDWIVEAYANCALTQAAYSGNWVGGEAGVIAWTSNGMASAEQQFGVKVNNKNTLKLAFGQTYNQGKETKEWTGPAKSTDLIDFETMFRLTPGAFIDPYFAGKLESQFYDDSDSDAGRFFNPIGFTESFGAMKILFEKNKLQWTARSGVAFKQNVERNVFDSFTHFREHAGRFQSSDFFESDRTTVEE